MKSIVAIRRCHEYDLEEVLSRVEWLYTHADGPDPSSKRVLVKPNILSDEDPLKAITTHPVVVEAVIRYLQSRGAEVYVGDSPTFDNRKFTGEKSGIRQVADSCGATWVRFNDQGIKKKAGSSSIKITNLVDRVDLIISVSKLKNHELMFFTGAVKNIFGLVQGYDKMVQHAKYPDRFKLAGFLVDLEEVVRPHFHIMDAITALEGPGPANGYPRKVNLLLASVNPLALDIIASRIVGYNPVEIPTNKIALVRGHLLKSEDDIIVTGEDPEKIAVKDFRRISTSSQTGIMISHLKKKIPLLKRLDKRPVFNSNLCTGCLNCVKICPVGALSINKEKNNFILVNEADCISCYCCHEVCRERAIEIKRKIF